ncbi:MAG: peroxiredoxin [Thermoanaerobaculaceae bacterium]|nr:peroxiredoxin [Thermoanaerobaculaceae bacterium]MDI9621882.1 peroxiredoxin [Acidobacteriota bacterium]NLH10483.1 peroxiredoxin [Holophagae bacterium]HPW55364.1 peroxiredoxin [Thermoanaerobaculaceae bacterium]
MKIASVVTMMLAALTVRAGEMLKPGDAFPAWELTDHTGALVSSTSLAGKPYLLWYYPKASTPGCTKEGCALRDSYADFTKLGVEVLGVSFDQPKDNAEFVTAQRFPFRLLSDTDKELAVAVAAADSPSRLWARRISYLVGGDGKVLAAYRDVDPATHAQQVLADVERLAPR